MRPPTKGRVLKERVWCFVEALLTHAEDSPDFEVHWETDKDTGRPNFVVKTKRRFLESLAQLKQHELYEVIESLKKLQIWDDRRLKRGKGSEIGWFALKLWSTDVQRNWEQFERVWEGSRTEKSKALEATYNESKDSPEASQSEIDWHDICLAMLEKQKRLTTNELLSADEDMKFELDDIHVPLALVQRTKPDKRNGDVSPEEGSRLLQPTYEEKQRFKHEEFLAQVLQEGKGQSKGRRIAVIGEPGAGKTTLLQRIAFWLFEDKNKNLGLPIWISLADLQGKTLEEYLLQRWLKNALEVARVTPEQENALVELFKKERVWLFLDGVDEIAGSSPGANHELPLQMVASQLEGWVAKARVVLSCRLNVWEANINALGDDFETYRLLDFEYPLQVKEFICRWFRKTDVDKGEQLWTELDKSERQRIQDLVKNPLRLALLCSAWQSSDKGLPSTKAGLYERFVEVFYTWKKNRFRTSFEQRQELNAALGRLALRAIDSEVSRFRLQHRFVCEVLGDPEQEDSLFWLALRLGWLNQVGLAAESETQEKVYAFYHPTFQEYFAALAINDWSFFLPRAHNNRNPKPVSERYRLFEPQWKEVILLWLGRYELAHEQKNEFIKALVEFEDGCGNFYHYRSYFRAALGIIEFKECSFINQIIVQLCLHICKYYNEEKQEKLIFTDSIKNEMKEFLIKMDRKKLIDTLTQLYYTAQDTKTCHEAAFMLWQIEPSNPDAYNLLSDSLINLISNPIYLPVTTEILETNKKINKHCIKLSKMLKILIKSNASAVSVIIGLIVGSYAFITSNGNENQYKIAILVTANCTIKTLIETPDILAPLLEWYQGFYLDILPIYDDKKNQQEIHQQTLQIKLALAFVNWLCTEPGSIVRSRLWIQLRPSNPKPKTGTIDWLVGFDNNSFYSFREKFIKFITKICLEEPGIIVNFLDCISTYFYEFKCLKEPYITQEPEYTPDKIAALTRLLHSCKNEFSLWLVADLLWKIDSENPDLIAALTKLLHTCKDKSIRWQVALLLLQIDKFNLEAITTLTDCLHNCKNESILRQAVEILAETGTSHPDTITALIQLLDTHADGVIGIKVADSLMKIGKSNLNAITALTKLLHTSANEKTCRLATDILKEIDPGNLDAVATLTQLLQSQDKSIRMQAADNLWEMNKGNPDASATLMDLLYTCQDQHTFKQAIISLRQKIGKSHPDVITALTKRLFNCENESIRIEAADNLWEMDKDNPDASATLMDLLHTCQDRNTFRQAIISLQQKIGKSHPDVITALTKRLSNCENESIRIEAADNLWEMDKDNPDASATLIALMQTSKDKSIRENLVWRLKKFAQPFLIAQVVTRLRSCLADKVKENEFKRYEACYDVIWHCAQNMTYPAFYQAWHQQEEVEKTTTSDHQSLNQADFPQSLQSALANDPQLSQITHLICIDGSQFIERDRPAAEIYDQMLDQNCPECNSVPETMLALKLYWNSFKRRSDKRVVLVFYASSTDTTSAKDTAMPYPYSETFLSDLSRFGDRICVVTNQSLDHILLKFFTPSQPIEDVMQWIRAITTEQ